MFNPEDYRSQKKNILKFFERKGVSNKSVSEYSALTSIPLTVIYTFISEDYPEFKDLCDRSISELNEFMGIK